MPSVSMFEDEKDNFICPFCKTKISSKRKSTIEYIKLAGNHYSDCYKNATNKQKAKVKYISKVGF
jgi:ribosomal protein L37AE/L43A